ncbi:hypothetical protein C5B42_01500 [Candidatus Cerribacteria bacterium 'Amazon FNV 2010 28 9']|uniref:Bifunctional protein FolD n=1 Tax=Candidatus Cerribacteria bacterium 'Amazon FNV 2010 28 9' TaxID=2081795 RepID=A0A317JUM6_9BACT|nr:MAG: hypothetical protein C5B42_01500 [Candidatus Cerribacteria bacterium 'Amazon FNV 2010 28 9']
MSIIFDGKAFAHKKELQLKKEVDDLRSRGIVLRVKTFTFKEDAGSMLYTRLKKEAAARIGIMYEPVEYSLHDDIEQIAEAIKTASEEKGITGVMVQKPAKAVFNQESIVNRNFEDWWSTLTAAIDSNKDVDCLTKENLERIYNLSPLSKGRIQEELVDGGEYVIPATVRACLAILEEAKRVLSISNEEWKKKKTLVIGRSDIVGKPLAALLKQRCATVENWGRKELEKSIKKFSIFNFQFSKNIHKRDHFLTTDFDIIISAVGKPNLITGTRVKEGAIVIDVGAPKGDVERESVESTASFLTPVPGGVGPMTVICLMESIVEIGKNFL